MTADHVYNLTVRHTVLAMYNTRSIKNRMLLLTVSLLFGSGFKSWARLSCDVLWFTSVLSGKSGHGRYLPRHRYVTPNTLRHKGI